MLPMAQAVHVHTALENDDGMTIVNRTKRLSLFSEPQICNLCVVRSVQKNGE